MNECDADRVLQVRQAVREQAHCELPAVEKLGDALHRWAVTPVGIDPVSLWLVIGGAFIAGQFREVLGRMWRDAKSSRKSS